MPIQVFMEMAMGSHVERLRMVGVGIEGMAMVRKVIEVCVQDQVWGMLWRKQGGSMTEWPFPSHGVCDKYYCI